MKRLTSILLLFMLCFTAYSQGESPTDSLVEQKYDEIKIFFDHNSYAINLDLQQNRESLSHFFDLYQQLNSGTLCTISKIEINSYTSPEGGGAPLMLSCPKIVRTLFTTTSPTT